MIGYKILVVDLSQRYRVYKRNIQQRYKMENYRYNEAKCKPYIEVYSGVKTVGLSKNQERV